MLTLSHLPAIPSDGQVTVYESDGSLRSLPSEAASSTAKQLVNDVYFIIIVIVYILM